MPTIRLATESDREWAAALMARSEPLGFLIHDLRGVAGAPYIKSVGVRDDVRGRGVGSGLMAHAERVCRRDGARDVFLCVSSFNPRARALYERLGYEWVGELADFAIAGASEALLRKRLGAGPSGE